MSKRHIFLKLETFSRWLGDVGEGKASFQLIIKDAKPQPARVLIFWEDFFGFSFC